MALDYFGFFGITKGVNLITINSQGWSLNLSVGYVFDLNKGI
mgnify:CR=1 FL=1